MVPTHQEIHSPNFKVYNAQARNPTGHGKTLMTERTTIWELNSGHHLTRRGFLSTFVAATASFYASAIWIDRLSRSRAKRREIIFANTPAAKGMEALMSRKCLPTL